jgi:hypothetical protein
MPEPISPTAPSPRRRFASDALAVLALVALWGVYFWRILTPSGADALSLTEGDFSGQFVAFMGYQTDRLSHGEIPLWNPYNYAGHPFLADTQSAVFYPPRLLTVALVTIFTGQSPGDLYAALQTEMALHVLLGTLLMYALVRRLTAPEGRASPRASVIGGLVAALTFGYSGYLSGYPQLQLAILEAGVWLSLILLGLFQATRQPGPRTWWRGGLCLVLAGVAMGLSLLAGHPQTSFFTLYLALAFLAWRLWRGSWRAWWRDFLPAAALFGLVAGGLAVIQLLPGLEYLQHTTRSAMNFDAKGNGFPFSDIAQVFFPGFLTLWSPLYVGIPGLVLAALAVARRVAYSAFFGVAALIALGLSFGAGTVIYHVAYLLVPGESWFRGQERAAFIVAQCVSILAGLGAAHALSWDVSRLAARRALERGMIALAGVCAVFAGVFFVLSRGPDGSTYGAALRSATFATFLAVLTAAALGWLLRDPADLRRGLALVALIVFDLFSITLGTPNYDPVPAWERLSEPATLTALSEMLPPGARVDGLRGLTGNDGTLYRIPDIRGISPLELQAIHDIRTGLQDSRVWDLLAVRYVLTDWNELSVPSTIVATGQDANGSYNVHELESPRDFAHLTYGVTVVKSDAEAYGLLREPSYDTRQWVILDSDPGLALPGTAPATPGQAEITTFKPEEIAVAVTAPSAAVLTLSLPDYPGWHATLNGQHVAILRAYGGLSAIALPGAGTYTVRLVYRPWTFTVGAAITAITLLLVMAVTLLATVKARRSRSAPSGGHPELAA